MTEPTRVDLAIIGSGTGNSIPDERFADQQVAIFEESIYGGTCLNVGCIPTKMFVYAAEVAETFRAGVDVGANLATHARCPVAAQVRRDRVDRDLAIGFAREERGDVVGHVHEVVDVHARTSSAMRHAWA